MKKLKESTLNIRLVGIALYALILVGCSSAPQPTVTQKPQVTPLALKKASLATPDAGVLLADTLLDHYLKAPAYRMSNPLLLRNYEARDISLSPDGKQLLKLFQSGRQWGFISVSTGYSPLINLFEVFDGSQTNYALVLKGVKICLVEGADRAPEWSGEQLRHSTLQPGNFECSASTRTSLFQPYSGIPNRLGIYFESGDTVLYDSDRQRLERIAALMAQRFNHLSLAESI